MSDRPPSRMLVIVGPQGSGKTTLAEFIARNAPGTIVFDEETDKRSIAKAARTGGSPRILVLDEVTPAMQARYDAESIQVVRLARRPQFAISAPPPEET